MAKDVRDVERERAMMDMYREGHTLQEIGTSFGITRERTRQLIGRHPGYKPYLYRRALRERRRAAMDAEWQPQLPAIKQMFMSGSTVREVAIACDISISEARRLRKMALPEPADDRIARAMMGKSKDLRYSDHELVNAVVEAAAELGERLTFQEYIAWAAGKKDRPSGALITLRMGWNKARSQAGLPMLRHTTGKPRTDKVENEELMAAVRRCAEDLGHVPSATEYDNWSRRRRDLSLALVRHRLGGMKPIIETLVAEGYVVEPALPWKERNR